MPSRMLNCFWPSTFSQLLKMLTYLHVNKFVSMPTCTFISTFSYHAILVTVVAPLECDSGASLRHTLSCCSDAFIHCTLARTAEARWKSGWIFFSINSNAKGILQLLCKLLAVYGVNGCIWLKLLSLQQPSISHTPCSAVVLFGCDIPSCLVDYFHSTA